MSSAGVTRRLLLSGGAAAALAACAQPIEVADKPREDPVGGIGGTGIVGTLTEFGSLIINGRRIATPKDMQVLGPFGPVAADQIAIGQALSLEAAERDGGLSAVRVLIADPLTGPVQAVTGDKRSVRVLGVWVDLDPEIAASAIGEFVSVSGIWRGDRVAASRIASAEPGRAAVLGVFRRDQEGYRVGGARVRLALRVKPPADGVFVSARGLLDRGNLIVVDLEEGRFTGAAGPLKSLSVEGYLDPISMAPFYEVAGLGHSFDQSVKLDQFAQSRVLLEGPYDGVFGVDEGLVLPEALALRRDALRTR